VPAGRLSYGHQKLVSLARAMATGADLLMLDEPTSGLPPELVGGILTIVRKLTAEGKTVLLIEHDMDVVFDVSDWIVVLDEGRRIFEGTTEEVRRNAEVRALYFGTRVG
jgi:ABC-type branched-subunit amino acid transport system ATPase component